MMINLLSDRVSFATRLLFAEMLLCPTNDEMRNCVFFTCITTHIVRRAVLIAIIIDDRLIVVESRTHSFFFHPFSTGPPSGVLLIHALYHPQNLKAGFAV